MIEKHPMTEADKVRLLAKSNLMTFSGALERRTFEHRGFSDRLVEALVACGIDAPERLLFMREQDLKNIPGVGPKAFREILEYRQRFNILP